MSFVKMISVSSIASFFKAKSVVQIIVLMCWNNFEAAKLWKNLSEYGFEVNFKCYNDWKGFDRVENHQTLGILFEDHENSTFLDKIDSKYFLTKYKWLIVSENTARCINGNFKYESDVTAAYLKSDENHGGNIGEDLVVTFEDVYSHPKEGVSLHPWAYWTEETGLTIHSETERIRRRQNFKNMVFRTGTPIGAYDSTYPGDFWTYLEDDRHPEQDSATRCGFSYMLNIFSYLNISCELIPAKYWSSLTYNRSMGTMMKTGEADVGGSILRMLHHRLPAMEFIGVLWPFRVGFTYVAARESDSNMYAAPFSPYVWWSTLACSLLLAVSLYLTSKSKREKDDAIYSTVATCLQQDASTVPEGASGRWVFMVLSICSMIIHAYYTSAVVSSLLDGGKGGPGTLRDLADSNLKVASEDVDYFRYLYFEEQTNWTALEYLKKKKKNAQFYQPLMQGVKLIGSGTTAYNTEFNGIYPLLAKELSDSGLCRATVLAERVNITDVMPLIYAMCGGVIASIIIFAVELIFYKFWTSRRNNVYNDETCSGKFNSIAESDDVNNYI